MARTNSTFVLDATRCSTKEEAKMDNSKAKLTCLLFNLKPAIKNSVDKHKYQKTIDSFQEHYS